MTDVEFWTDGSGNRHNVVPDSHPAVGRDRMTIDQILSEVADTPPWAYTYRERPIDLLEIRASELQAILEAHLIGRL